MLLVVLGMMGMKEVLVITSSVCVAFAHGVNNACIVDIGKRIG